MVIDQISGFQLPTNGSETKLSAECVFVRRATMTSKLAVSQTRSKSGSNSSKSSAASGASSCTHSKVSPLGFKSPVLGNNFRIPDVYSELQDIQLDDTLPYVPVYCHLKVPEIEPIFRPKTPPILNALRAELEELQLIKTTKIKPEQKSRSTPRVNQHRQSNKNHRRTDANVAN
ncbi:WD repeat-containing protein on Y chromosome-like [Phymastichus coffea]|uniref:WD repeat-containing protein on Y chromosome-like n=1 Tax=Phymastichus coffea TaxID=108790 RepID=UPI00273A989E|nr:WD repeat-containing protein on Y chromosome-like [Phymastichus coffea]